MMYTVYGRATSSNVQALLWGMEELGLTYDRLDYGGEFGGLDTPAFAAISPHGQIPVLQDGEMILWETPAILRFLAGEHGDDRFWPGDARKRAHVDMWAEWANIPSPRLLPDQSFGAPHAPIPTGKMRP